MQIKWSSVKIAIIPLLFVNYFNLGAMTSLGQQVRRGTPEHLKMVPTSSQDDGVWRFVTFAQGIYNGCRALVAPSQKIQHDAEPETRFDIKAVPRVASEMVLTEAIYHGVNAACKTQNFDLDSSLSLVRAAGSSCSRLAAYTISQKCRQLCFSKNADQEYKKNVRAMLEDATASVIWASIKDTSRGVGLTNRIGRLLVEATYGRDDFEKLPFFVRYLGGLGVYLICGVVDYIGKALVKDTVVIPLSDKIFGVPS
jgi:hypothetical protein